jgi:hypothetical protein
MEGTMRHPPGPACIACGRDAVAEVAGTYLCAVHAIDAMDSITGTAGGEKSSTLT